MIQKNNEFQAQINFQMMNLFRVKKELKKIFFKIYIYYNNFLRPLGDMHTIN